MGWSHPVLRAYGIRPRGASVLGGPGKAGRRRSYLSWDEEALFLESFRQAALTGQIAAAAEIKVALERRIGQKVHKTTVYRLLKRHGWRKLVPRPFQVDAVKAGRKQSLSRVE